MTSFRVRGAAFLQDLTPPDYESPEPFDLVLCSEILEHLAEPHDLLVAMRERLSPEGLLVLSTPTSRSAREDRSL